MLGHDGQSICIIPSKKMIVLRMGLTAGGASVWFLLLLAKCLHAFTFAAHHSTCIALLSHQFPGSLRARGQALYTILAYGVPGVLGGLLGGVLSTNLGLPSVFWAGLLSSALATYCAWRVWCHLHGSKRQSA